MKDLSHILKECSVKDIYYVNSGTVTRVSSSLFLKTSWKHPC